ncbi:uncharacterized protein ACMZJ9_014833 isoform 2-T2 [Mantella aurantiaca]
MRLDGGQKDVYRNAMKEIHRTLTSRGYTILNPNIIFSIRRQDESPIRTDGDSEGKKIAVAGDFPDILMNIKEEPIGETPISQGEHCVLYVQPSTSSQTRTSHAALIKSEAEEGLSIDYYNSAGGDATPGNSAGVPGGMKQEPDYGDEEETDNEDLENIIPVIVKQEEPVPARNDQDEETQPAHHSANITDPMIGLIDEAILLVTLRRRRLRELEEKRSRRRYRARPLMSQRLANRFSTLYGDLRKSPKAFFDFTQMSVSTFDALLEVLRPRLVYLDTYVWRSVSAEERLLVTLRFLTTGQMFESLHHYFQLSVSTVVKTIQETCVALWEELHEAVMPEPTEELWKELAEEFWEKTQFPNCIAALEGRHIRVQMPPSLGLTDFSIALLGLVDVHCRFVAIDVGAYGSAGDPRVFMESTMGRRLHEGHLRIPPAGPLPSTSQPYLPKVIAADEAFGLMENLMCPYSGPALAHKQKIFNYRLSRAHRMAECAFNVCTAKWRILLSEIPLGLDAVKVVLACCALHNFVIDRERVSSYPAPPDSDPDRPFMDSLPTTYATVVRNSYANFFVSPEGNVAWQDDYV